MSEDEVIKNFSQAQLKKLELRKNRYQPMEWRNYNIHTLFRLLKAEVEELHQEIEQGNNELAKEEAVDVANFAMFIHDRL